jgi:predicted DNA-binding transcriptional regulator AlpA
MRDENCRQRPVGQPTGPTPFSVHPEGADPAQRLTWRLADVVKALGVSRRTIERERSAGRFPRPDRIMGRAPLWMPETIRAWVEGGSRR